MQCKRWCLEKNQVPVTQDAYKRATKRDRINSKLLPTRQDHWIVIFVLPSIILPRYISIIDI